MLQVLHGRSDMSKWAYVYEALVKLVQNADGGAKLHQCLLLPNSSVRLMEMSTARKSAYQCYKGIDKNMWGAWQTAYGVFQQGIFTQSWSLLSIHMSVDYNVFFAYWSGFLSALLSATIAACAFLVYYIGALCYACVKLRKKHHQARPQKVIMRQAPIKHNCKREAVLVQAEAGIAGMAVQNSNVAAIYKALCKAINKAA